MGGLVTDSSTTRSRQSVQSKVAAGAIYLSVGSLVGVLLVPLTLVAIALRVLSLCLAVLPLAGALFVRAMMKAVRRVLPHAGPEPAPAPPAGPTWRSAWHWVAGVTPGGLLGIPLLRAAADLERLLAAAVLQTSAADGTGASGGTGGKPAAAPRRRGAAVWGDLGYLGLLLLGLIWLMPVLALSLPVVAFVVSLPFGRTEQLSFGEGNTIVVEGAATRIGVGLGAAVLFVLLVMLLFWLGRLRARLVRRILGRVDEDERLRREVLAEQQRIAALRVNDADYRRIERDLHDGAQARLAAVMMRISQVTRRPGRSAEDLRKVLEETHHEIDQALDEIRDLVHGIQPPILSDRGLRAAVAALTDKFYVPVRMDCTLERRPAVNVEAAAYFIIAESLTNAVKHASPTVITVSLAQEGNHLVAVVTDDGVGGATPQGGTGVRGMADRATALNGEVVLTSPAGGPTTVRVVLPWSPAGL
ncbi:sensor histidine kinase [Streptomyces sp. ISL-44]|uniref:sensor histidine kinase n=1 Tax=Streptomyces sp. ISL-44 TaxID=2819184 RepID=UPI001BE9F8E5|nr:histidine kinase [Streptomyces sp. ISL-44]MBT2543809.1 sensor histidine kinase [Streptomyces sp. ISL-44]